MYISVCEFQLRIHFSVLPLTSNGVFSTVEVGRVEASVEVHSRNIFLNFCFTKLPYTTFRNDLLTYQYTKISN